MFVYGKAKANETYVERALQFMEELEGESNSIITNWKSLNILVEKAHVTQALPATQKQLL